MLCPRCGNYTDDTYPNCVNCGMLLHPPQVDKAVDSFAKMLVWLIVVAVALTAITTIVYLVFFLNVLQSVP